ncbi:MAG: hypothetical protein JNK64_02580 [Myxococcales bacterium]|nr:hypothetical protein [Myxococcales bacterium]
MTRPASPDGAVGATMASTPLRTATDTLDRFRDALAGEDAFLEIVDAAPPTEAGQVSLADWACRVVTSLALDAADARADAVAVRGAPALTLASADDWAQRLARLVDRVARDPEVAAFERGDYQALITIQGLEDCALVIATAAAARAVDLPAVACAARLVRQLVGPAVVDYDYWRDRAVWLPDGIVDGEVDEACDRAEHRYRRFFDAEPDVLASLAAALR